MRSSNFAFSLHLYGTVFNPPAWPLDGAHHFKTHLIVTIIVMRLFVLLLSLYISLLRGLLKD